MLLIRKKPRYGLSTSQMRHDFVHAHALKSTAFCFACSFPLGGVGPSHGLGVPWVVQGADLYHFGLLGNTLSCAV